MSLHRSLYLVLALAASLAPLAPSLSTPAAAATSTVSSGDQTRPQVMRRASLASPGLRASTSTVCPAPPAYSGPRPKREIFGFVQAGAFCSDRGYQTYNYGALTTIAYFGLHINAADGSIVQTSTDTGWRVWQTPDIDSMVQVAHASGVRAVLTVIYQDDGAGMCTALQHSATTVGQITAQVQARHLDGVNIDYEGLNAACGSSDNRSLLRAMAQAFRSALGAAANLTVDTYAGSASDSRGFYDIPGMAAAVDAFFVMAYDLDGTSAGGNWTHAPLNCTRYCLSPNSPLGGYYWNDTRIVSEYSTAAGPGKTILGLPYYGYTACVDAVGPNAYPSSAPNWGTPTYADSVSALSDPTYAPYNSYRDQIDPTSRYDSFHNPTYNCTRESYWNDDVSLAAKYDLVNSSGIAGVGLFSLDYAGAAPELWNQLAGHFTLRPSAPAATVACSSAASVEVGWTPAASAGSPITSYVVTANPGGASLTVPGSATEASFPVSAVGTGPHSFSVVAVNSYGPGPASPASGQASISPAAEAYSGYFSWYDRRSPGMATDNIHLVNPGLATVTGCAILPGVAVAPFTVPAGAERYVAFDPGSIGGPVKVVASGRVIASQRVAYYQSFNEVAARTAGDASTSQYFNWYDNASPGMTTDMIHVLNPGSLPASVTVSVQGASPLSFNLAPGEQRYGAFPPGTIGGPVQVASTSPVLASQRVAYYQSFNEVPGSPAARAATTLYFNWYDRQSAGMNVDNIHLVNPGPGSASGSVSLPGAASQAFSLAAGQEQYVSFPVGVIGGPVTVNSSAPVLASQRVSYYSSFNEVAGRSAAEAAQTLLFNWYDSQSPGMNSDNVHLLNPGPAALTGTISLGGTVIQVALAPGQEGYYGFPAGTIGGPVTVQASAPVLGSQRVAFYQSFNEVSGQS